MWQFIVRTIVGGVIIAAVTLVSNRSPRLGAFLLTLPVISILSFFMTWYAKQDLAGISRLARETLVLVPLGLPFFVPLAFAQRWSMGFWNAFAAGLAVASLAIGLWLWVGPKTL